MKIFFDALSTKPTTSVGTQAYIISGMQIIARKFPNVEFILLSINPEVDNHYLKQTNLNFKLIKRNPSFIKTWIQVKNILNEVDVVVSSWGDAYITYAPHNLFRKALMLKKRNVPLLLFTSSIGPFPSKGIKSWIAKLGLMMFDELTVRDKITYDYLTRMNIKNLKLVHDSAFVLEPSDMKNVSQILEQSGLKDKEYIGLNISVLLYNLYKEKGRDYALEMAEYVTWLNKTFNMPVVLIPHQIFPSCLNYSEIEFESRGGDDRYAINKVLELTNENVRVYGLLNEYSPMELKGIIKGSQIFIGGRMHSVIAAISTATPAIILQYSHKAGGMMKFLNLEGQLWDVDESIEKLYDLTLKLWENKVEIKETLNSKLPHILTEVNQLANLIPLKR